MKWNELLNGPVQSIYIYIYIYPLSRSIVSSAQLGQFEISINDSLFLSLIVVAVWRVCVCVYI